LKNPHFCDVTRLPIPDRQFLETSGCNIPRTWRFSIKGTELADKKFARNSYKVKFKLAVLNHSKQKTKRGSKAQAITYVGFRVFYLLLLNNTSPFGCDHWEKKGSQFQPQWCVFKQRFLLKRTVKSHQMMHKRTKNTRKIRARSEREVIWNADQTPIQ
jgi:hypothetical protein